MGKQNVSIGPKPHMAPRMGESRQRVMDEVGATTPVKLYFVKRSQQPTSLLQARHASSLDTLGRVLSERERERREGE